jgi:regulator of sigma E protease
MHDILIKAGEFILAISILVLIHELGHFLAARAFGIRVEKFFLFFDVGGVKLFSIKRGHTTYGIGWLPLGGYVKITGMIDESMDKNFAQSEPQPYEFRSKPAWQRLIVMLAGIFNNVILGILIFSLHVAYYGDNFVSPQELNNGIIAHSLAREAGFKTGDIIVKMNGEKLKKAEDIENSNLVLRDDNSYEIIRNGKDTVIRMPKGLAKKLSEGRDSFLELRLKFKVDTFADAVKSGTGASLAGLKPGDSIVAVNDTATKFYNDFKAIVLHNKNKDIAVKVVRAGSPAPFVIKGKVDAEGVFGFTAKLNTESERHSIIESFGIGAYKAWHAVADNVVGLWRLITGALPSRSLHSLIGIANVFPSHWDWSSFWSLTALLSMVLAFMNLLPIPALDGGHVIFLLVEMVRRKPVSIKVLEVAQMVGMAFLFLLMGFALYNDVAQFVFKR